MGLWDIAALPPDAELRRMVQDGLTHNEIAAEVTRRTGFVYPAATLSAALSRATLTETTGHRYFDCIPWRVRPSTRPPSRLRMLRLLGKRRSGFPLDDVSAARLDAWLQILERERLVVAYCPEQVGFVYVDESLRGGPNPDLPIRVQAGGVLSQPSSRTTVLPTTAPRSGRRIRGEPG